MMRYSFKISFIFPYLVSYPLFHISTFSELSYFKNRIIIFNQNFIEYNLYHWLTAVSDVKKLSEVDQSDDSWLIVPISLHMWVHYVCVNGSVCTCVWSSRHNSGCHFLGVSHFDFFF